MCGALGSGLRLEQPLQGGQVGEHLLAALRAAECTNQTGTGLVQRCSRGARRSSGRASAQNPQPYVLGVYNSRMGVEVANRRLNMRLSAEQEDLLREAASRQGQSVTGFVLAAATERARELLDTAERIELSRRAFESFLRALDEPVAAMPTLHGYARP